MPGEENGRQWLGGHRRPVGHEQRKGTGGGLDGQGPGLAGVVPEGFELSTERDFIYLSEPTPIGLFWWDTPSLVTRVRASLHEQLQKDDFWFNLEDQP